MADEASQLRCLLGLPVNDTWIDKKDEALIPDAGEAHSSMQMSSTVDSICGCCLHIFYCITDLAETKDEKRDKKAVAKEERDGMKSRLKDEIKGEAKLAAIEKTAEVRRQMWAKEFLRRMF